MKREATIIVNASSERNGKGTEPKIVMAAPEQELAAEQTEISGSITCQYNSV
ncbi:hypothetical protein GCM10027287_19190 [Bordetella muralis]